MKGNRNRLPYLLILYSFLLKYVIEYIYYSDKQGDSFPIESFPKGWFGKKKLYEKINGDIIDIIESLISYSKEQSKIEDDNW